MGHQIRIMGVFGRRDIGCQNGRCGKKQQQGKPDDGRRVPENPIHCKFNFPQSRMEVGLCQLGAFYTDIAIKSFDTTETGLVNDE